MGNTQSSEIMPFASRSPSPLPGFDHDGDGVDGLPRVSSTLPADGDSLREMPDGLPLYASQPEPAERRRRKKKSKKRRHSAADEQRPRHGSTEAAISFGEHEEEGLVETEHLGTTIEAYSQDLQVAASENADQVHVHPLGRIKKKRSRRSRGRDMRDVLDRPPALETTTPSRAPEQELDGSLAGGSALGSTLPTIASQTEADGSSPSRKERGNDRTKTGRSGLDLDEDPIAGSDQEGVIPSSAPRKHASDEASGSGSSRRNSKRPRAADQIEDPISAPGPDTPREGDVVGDSQVGVTSSDPGEPMTDIITMRRGEETAGDSVQAALPRSERGGQPDDMSEYPDEGSGHSPGITNGDGERPTTSHDEGGDAMDVDELLSHPQRSSEIRDEPDGSMNPEGGEGDQDAAPSGASARLDGQSPGSAPSPAPSPSAKATGVSDDGLDASLLKADHDMEADHEGAQSSDGGDRQAEDPLPFADLDDADQQESHLDVEAAPEDSPSSPAPEKPKDKEPKRKEPGSKEPRSRGGIAASSANARNGYQLDRSGRYRQGPMTKTEIDQVKGAIEDFRLANDLEQYALNNLIQENPRNGQAIHRDLWSRVQEACPTRTRGKLIHWSRHHFHNFVARGTWTEEQDEELRSMVATRGKKWAEIGSLINRHQHDVRDRWRNYLVCNPQNWKVSVWMPDETERFLGIVCESMLVAQNIREEDPDDERLQGLSNEQMLDWSYISERMDFTRSRLQCQEKWKRVRQSGDMNQRLSDMLAPESGWRQRQAQKELLRMSDKERARLVRGVRDSAAEDDEGVPWAAMVKAFNGRFQRLTLVIAWEQLKRTVPDFKTATAHYCARQILAAHQSQGSLPNASGDVSEGDGHDPDLWRIVTLGEAERRERRKTKGKEQRTKGKERLAKGEAKGEGKKKTPLSEEMVRDDDSSSNDGAEPAGTGSDVVPESDPEEESDRAGASSRASGYGDAGRPPRRSASPHDDPDEEGTARPDDASPDHGRGERDASVDLSLGADLEEDPEAGSDNSAGGGASTRRGEARQKRAAGKATAPTSKSEKRSRKRARAEQSPELKQSSRKKKRRTRDGRSAPDVEPDAGQEDSDDGGAETQLNGNGSDVSSSMSDMEDIPARLQVNT